MQYLKSNFHLSLRNISNSIQSYSLYTSIHLIKISGQIKSGLNSIYLDIVNKIQIINFNYVFFRERLFLYENNYILITMS